MAELTQASGLALQPQPQQSQCCRPCSACRRRLPHIVIRPHSALAHTMSSALPSSHHPFSAHTMFSALLCSSTSCCLTRRSSSRLTGVMSLGSICSTMVTRLVTASSSASSRPAGHGVSAGADATNIEQLPRTRGNWQQSKLAADCALASHARHSLACCAGKHFQSHHRSPPGPSTERRSQLLKFEAPHKRSEHVCSPHQPPCIPSVTTNRAALAISSPLTAPLGS